MPRVLVVEDDAAVREVLTWALSREGLQVESACDGETGFTRFREAEPVDLVVLDVSLPGMDGYTLCREMRKTSELPIIMLTARSDEASAVVGLEVGADDYMTKPFSPSQLTNRIQTYLRRDEVGREDSECGLLKFPSLTIDLTSRRVKVRGEDVELSSREVKVLELLASHPGQVYSRGRILSHLWGEESLGDLRAADVHIQHLRNKIEVDAKNPLYLVTVRRRGYKFVDAR